MTRHLYPHNPFESTYLNMEYTHVPSFQTERAMYLVNYYSVSWNLTEPPQFVLFLTLVPYQDF